MKSSNRLRFLTLALSCAASGFGLWLSLSGRGTPVDGDPIAGALLYGTALVLGLAACVLLQIRSSRGPAMTAVAVIASIYLWSGIAGFLALFLYLAETRGKEEPGFQAMEPNSPESENAQYRPEPPII